MNRKCTVHRIGMHTAWITVEGDRNNQLIAVPIEIMRVGHGDGGSYPGDIITVKFLPHWVEEVVGPIV